MYYSLAELRQGARFKADQYQTQRIQNDELDGYINDGIDQAQTVVFPLNENYFVRTKTEDLVSGTQSYLQPDHAKALIAIDISFDNGENYRDLTERNIDRRNYNNSSFFSLSGAYSFYFQGNGIVLLGDITSNFTDGLRWIYVWEHWNLDDDSAFQATVTEATRASDVISVTTSAAHNVENGQLITLASMDDSTFDGTHRVVSVPTTTTLTCRQEGFADDSGAGNTGTLYRRYGMDLPGGRTVKRYVEAWAVYLCLHRDGKDLTAISDELSYLGKRLKMNLNYRKRGKTKKVRLRGTYRRTLPRRDSGD